MCVLVCVVGSHLVANTIIRNKAEVCNIFQDLGSFMGVHVRIIEVMLV